LDNADPILNYRLSFITDYSTHRVVYADELKNLKFFKNCLLKNISLLKKLKFFIFLDDFLKNLKFLSLY